MTATYTPGDLAEMLHTSPKRIHEWRRSYGWPSLKIGKTILFTQEHVEQILAKHASTPKKAADVAPVIAGQTKRSARRSA